MDWRKDEQGSCLVTYSLGVIIVRFCIIFFHVEGIALLFEAFRFPALKCGREEEEKNRLNLKKTRRITSLLSRFIIIPHIQHHMPCPEL